MYCGPLTDAAELNHGGRRRCERWGRAGLVRQKVDSARMRRPQRMHRHNGIVQRVAPAYADGNTVA